MDPTKRELRETKRAVKRAGNKHRRLMLKRTLIDNPEEAAAVEESFGRHRSSKLNGIDRDSTRKKAGPDPIDPALRIDES
ncbi:hypothetical protein TA3x_002836 [Tundrisphaera sp. TA3]|uniref:hypothetical protein n=1 Tax=Tundrisphaera sp. TA3 TaxID=3435775 RepID=UPI003EBF1AF9